MTTDEIPSASRPLTDEWRPNKWIAGVLGVFLQYLTFLYVARWRWAVAYVALALLTALVEYFRLGGGSPQFQTERLIGSSALCVACAVHGYWLAAKSPGVSPRPRYSRWYGVVGIPLLALLPLLVARIYLVQPFRMPSGSMLPTIKIGNTFLVSKIGFGNRELFGLVLSRNSPSAEIHRGDLIAFNMPLEPAKQYVKRLVGLPGDALRYKGKVLFINGVAATRADGFAIGGHRLMPERMDNVSYSVLIDDGRPAEDFDYKVPADEYFMMGDNRDGSYDSRGFGAVPGELLLGRVVYVFSDGVDPTLTH